MRLWKKKPKDTTLFVSYQAFLPNDHKATGYSVIAHAEPLQTSTDIDELRELLLEANRDTLPAGTTVIPLNWIVMK